MAKLTKKQKEQIKKLKEENEFYKNTRWPLFMCGAVSASLFIFWITLIMESCK